MVISNGLLFQGGGVSYARPIHIHCPLCRQRINLTAEIREEEDEGKSGRYEGSTNQTKRGHNSAEDGDIGSRMERLEHMMSFMTLTLLSKIEGRGKVDDTSGDLPFIKQEDDSLSLDSDGDIVQKRSKGKDPIRVLNSDKSGNTDCAYSVPLNSRDPWKMSPRVASTSKPAQSSRVQVTNGAKSNPTPPTRCTLWVGGWRNLNPTREELLQIFSEADDVRYAWYPSGLRRPFVFIDFKSMRASKRAFKHHETMIFGCRITIRTVKRGDPSLYSAPRPSFP